MENGGHQDPGTLSWVGASGIEGVESITIRPFVQPENPDLDREGKVQAFRKNVLNQAIKEMWPGATGSFGSPQPYTVRLYFWEVDRTAKGKRVFDVVMQGKTLLKEFDVAAETESNGGCLVKEFMHIPVKDTLQVKLRSRPGQTAPTLICGIELIAEE